MQLEIKYFWPLTEQIPLGLDYTPSEEYQRNKSSLCIAGLGCVTAVNGLGFYGSSASASIEIKPYGTAVCSVEPFEGFKVNYTKKPNFFRRVIMKYVLGWKMNNA